MKNGLIFRFSMVSSTSRANSDVRSWVDCYIIYVLGFPGDSWLKNPPTFPESTGEPLEKEMANPLQYSSLGNPMDRGVWQAAVHGSQSWTQLIDWTTTMLSLPFLVYSLALQQGYKLIEKRYFSSIHTSLPHW